MPDIKMSVPIDEKVRAKLQVLADKDRRSAGSYVAKLIEAHIKAESEARK